MTTETTTSPRFVRISRGAAVLAHPLPERLAATLPAKARREHEQLVQRVGQAGREIARLRSEIDAAPAADHNAARDAALRGEPIPEPSEGRLRAEFDQATRTRDAVEAALRQSADGLLQAAAPKAEEVAAELERELGAATEELRGRLADLDDGLAELGELFGQAAWTRALTHATGSSVSPFGRSTREFSETRGKLSVVTQALDYELGGIEERRRDAEAERAQRAELDAEWAAEREQLAAKAKEGQRSER